MIEFRNSLNKAIDLWVVNKQTALGIPAGSSLLLSRQLMSCLPLAEKLEMPPSRLHGACVSDNFADLLNWVVAVSGAE